MVCAYSTGSSGSEIAAARERIAEQRCAGVRNFSRDVGALACGCAVQARSRAGLDSASARQRSNVATEIPNSSATLFSDALSGGSNLATARSCRVGADHCWPAPL